MQLQSLIYCLCNKINLETFRHRKITFYFLGKLHTSYKGEPKGDIKEKSQRKISELILVIIDCIINPFFQISKFCVDGWDMVHIAGKVQ